MKFIFSFILSFIFLTSTYAESFSSSKGIIATSNPHASRAAKDIIDRGGNAIDASVAVQLVLTLTEPQATGIGGGAFMLYWDESKSKLYSVDGREKAPSKVTENLFLDSDGNKKKFYPDAVVGSQSVGVPGIIKLLEETHKKFGKLPWEELFKYAINLAENGFPVSPALNSILGYLKPLKEIEPAASYYFIENSEGLKKPVPVGHILKNIEYSKTLKRLSKYGSYDFYEGETAKLIIDALNNNNKDSKMSFEDLRNYQIVWREPLCRKYRSYNVCAMGPPSSGGLTMLMMLKIFENFNVSSMDPNSIEMIHLFSEVNRIAYADRDYYMGDSDFIDVPVEGLLNKSYLSEREKLITLNRYSKTITHGNPPGAEEFEKNIDISKPSTSHFVIVDKEGNAVSMTSTVEGPFGSHLMAGGFILNNELTDFSMIPELNGKKIANRVEPNKRPMHTIIPGLLMKQDTPIMPFGVMGAHYQPVGQSHFLTNVIDFEMDVQLALDHQRSFFYDGVLSLEKNFNKNIINLLEKSGHKIEFIDIPHGGGQAIMISQNNILIGGSDPRKDGIALGF